MPNARGDTCLQKFCQNLAKNKNQTAQVLLKTDGNAGGNKNAPAVEGTTPPPDVNLILHTKSNTIFTIIVESVYQ